MKKVLMLFMAIVLFAGCQKEPDSGDTTYTLRFMDGILYDLYDLGSSNDYMAVDIKMVFAEYYQGQRVAALSENVSKSRDEIKIKANHKTEYITVRLDVKYYDHYYGDDDFKKSLYIANVFYLEKGKDNLIELGHDTLTTEKEPK